jgi:hypothetical protein
LNTSDLEHWDVVDTHEVFPNPSGKRTSLRWLAKQHLGRTIQDKAKEYDAKEDALTALDLMKKKAM